MNEEEPTESLRARKRPSSPATWYSLPEAVAANIIARVAELRFENVPTLRLVSKSWRDAMWAYRGCIGTKDEGNSYPEQMRTMCKILPNAGQLQIWSYIPIIMDGMRQLKRVRDVSLAFELHFGTGDEMEPPVDLNVLPPTVTKLNLDNIGLDLSTIEQIQFTLRSLKFTLWEDDLPHALALISRQLKLEDVALITSGLVPKISMSAAFESHLGRLSSLTSLILCRADLQPMAADPRFPPSLRELSLYDVRFSAQWASQFCEASTKLTLLEMECVSFLEGEEPPDLQPISSLRSMVLKNGHPKLLDVAGPEFQSLDLIGRWGAWNREEPFEGHRLDRLIGMTKLKLTNYRACQLNLAALHSLKLRELTLLDCANVEAVIFKPGALTALEVLHIEESAWARAKGRAEALQADPAEIEAKKRQLQEAGAVVLGLPMLRQLSGSYGILSTWMASSSQGSARLWTSSKVHRQAKPRDDGATMIHTYIKI